MRPESLCSSCTEWEMEWAE